MISSKENYIYSLVEHLMIAFEEMLSVRLAHQEGPDERLKFEEMSTLPNHVKYWVNISFNGLIDGDYFLALNIAEWKPLLKEALEVEEVNDELIASTFKEILNVSCGSAINAVCYDFPDLTVSPPKILKGEIDYPKMTVLHSKLTSVISDVDLYLCLNLMEQSLGNRIKKVEKLMSQLKEKTQSIRSIMKSIQQGIFTILPNQTIHEEYSLFLEDILEKKELAGKNIVPLLFENSNLPPDSIANVEQTLKFIIGENVINYEANREIFPTGIVKKFSGKKKKNLSLDWQPIVNSSSIVERVMVAIKDQTELEKLKSEKNEQQEELQTINQILKISIQQFQRFLDHSKERIRNVKDGFSLNDNLDKDDVNSFLRSLHSIKGNARTYKLSKLVNFIHLLEKKFTSLKLKDLSSKRQDILKDLNQLESHILSAEKKFSYLIKSYEYAKEQESKHIYIQSNEYETLLDELKKIDLNLYRKFKVTIDTAEEKTVREVIRPAIENLPSLAEELGKESPQVHFENELIHVLEKYELLLLDIVTHLTRNSVYHGIGTKVERIEEGKSANGNIYFNFVKMGKSVDLVYHDDGKGLDIGAIRQKFALVDRSDEEVASYLLNHGGSTVEHSDLISGSGLGLNAIYSFLGEIGGKIKILLQDEANTLGNRAFQVHLSIPGE